MLMWAKTTWLSRRLMAAERTGGGAHGRLEGLLQLGLRGDLDQAAYPALTPAAGAVLDGVVVQPERVNLAVSNPEELSEANHPAWQLGVIEGGGIASGEGERVSTVPRRQVEHASWAEWDFTLKRRDSGTTLTCVARFSLRRRFALMAPALYLLGGRGIRRDLSSLKHVIEQDALSVRLDTAPTGFPRSR